MMTDELNSLARQKCMTCLTDGLQRLAVGLSMSLGVDYAVGLLGLLLRQPLRVLVSYIRCMQVYWQINTIQPL